MKKIILLLCLFAAMAVQAQNTQTEITPQDAIDFVNQKFQAQRINKIPAYPWFNYLSKKFIIANDPDKWLFNAWKEVYANRASEIECDWRFTFHVKGYHTKDDYNGYPQKFSTWESIYIDYHNIDTFYFIEQEGYFLLCLKKKRGEKVLLYSLYSPGCCSSRRIEDDFNGVKSHANSVQDKDNETPIELFYVSEKLQAERLCKALNFLVNDAKAKNVEKF